MASLLGGERKGWFGVMFCVVLSVCGAYLRRKAWGSRRIEVVLSRVCVAGRSVGECSVLRALAWPVCVVVRSSNRGSVVGSQATPVVGSHGCMHTASKSQGTTLGHPDVAISPSYSRLRPKPVTPPVCVHQMRWHALPMTRMAGGLCRPAGHGSQRLFETAGQPCSCFENDHAVRQVYYWHTVTREVTWDRPADSEAYVPSVMPKTDPTRTATAA